jgi:hypothetical protein
LEEQQGIDQSNACEWCESAAESLEIEWPQGRGDRCKRGNANDWLLQLVGT